MERALRIAGVLLVLGLVVEALSLHWNTAFLFLSFMIVGGVLLVAGVLLYLISLLQHTHQGKSPRDL
jgi:predicted membrane channel-forming protein YqfA (hemolysin III family)